MTRCSHRNDDDFVQILDILRFFDRNSNKLLQVSMCSLNIALEYSRLEYILMRQISTRGLCVIYSSTVALL
jgi:hypothetical protein